MVADWQGDKKALWLVQIGHCYEYRVELPWRSSAVWAWGYWGRWGRLTIG